jgi:hypothetical protein
MEVTVHVDNDQGLTALDIPIRFGQPGDPIWLDSVHFTDRVADWDKTHAVINNQNKTVILGLFAVMGRIDETADLEIATSGNTAIATMVFSIEGSYEPQFQTFTTTQPDHELMFLYYRYVTGNAFVESFTPQFEVEEISAKQAAMPLSFELSHNYPNPFNASTRFTLSLPAASNYEIRIINVAGQVVKRFSGRLEAGLHAFTWDGLDDGGREVGSGVYFYRARVGEFSATQMMLLLK